jgi:hypothetical protein
MFYPPMPPYDFQALPCEEHFLGKNEIEIGVIGAFMFPPGQGGNQGPNACGGAGCPNDAIVTLPTSHPTCPVFGGEDLSTLFIASARFGLSSYQLHEEPEAGSIFAVSTGLGGIAEPRYIGPRHADDL